MSDANYEDESRDFEGIPDYVSAIIGDEVLREVAQEEASTNALLERMFKIRKRLDEDLIDELEALDTSGLRERIVRSEVNQLETERARDADGDLREKKRLLGEAQGPYRDAMKQQKTIANYCACLLDQRGKA